MPRPLTIARSGRHLEARAVQEREHGPWFLVASPGCRAEWGIPYAHQSYVISC